MKQAYKLLLPLLGLSLIAATLAEWVSFAIDERVSMQAPAKLTEVDLVKLAPGKDMRHTRLWTLRATEGVYQVMRLSNSLRIPKTDTAGRRAFYAGVFTSVIRNESAQFISITPFSTAGGAGMEYKYKGLHKGTGKRVIKYGRVLLLDSIGYTLNFIPTDRQDSLGLAGAEQRRRFFNSITVKP